MNTRSSEGNRDTRRFERPIVRRLRELCLSLPEVNESASWGHPNFRREQAHVCYVRNRQGWPSIAFRRSGVISAGSSRVFIMFRHLALHDFLHAYRIEELLLKKDWAT